MSFEMLAPHYRFLESILAGNILQRCRTAFLSETANSRRALLLGEGPGRFLVELLRTNPQVEVTCLELSPRMIIEAHRELIRNGLEDRRVVFEQRDALTWQPPLGVFDLVASNFFFDCFRPHELKKLFTTVRASTTREARWLLADFCQPDKGWQKWRAKAVLALMYAFFRCATRLSASRLTPPDEYLEAAGFELVERRLENFGLVHSDFWRRSK